MDSTSDRAAISTPSEPSQRSVLDELLRYVQEEGRAGRSVSVVKILDEHPQLWSQKSFVVELAYEDFLQRCKNGLDVDIEDYCNQYPGYQTTLLRLLALHEVIRFNPGLLEQASSPWPAVGTTWLGFHLLEELGRGTCSRVFLASETALGDRKVALKISRDGANEARLLGRLQHRNIVPIHGVHVDPSDGWTGISMPYRGRNTLEDVLDGSITLLVRGMRATGASSTDHRSKRLSPARVGLALRIGIQIASALGTAHRQGIVHGDLKPSNVLIDDDGNACILDFNLAASLGELSPCLGGTLPYMAPEQLRQLISGEKVCTAIDPASDLFALGVILHQLITGYHPYASDFARLSHLPPREIAQELLQRQEAKIPFLGYRGLEPSLVKVLRGCLSLDVSERPDSADQLCSELRRRDGLVARCHRWVLRYPGRAIAAGLLSLAIASAAVAWFATRPTLFERELEGGLSAVQQGRLEEGIENLRHSVSIDPSSIRARLALAYAYQAHGDFPLALTEYEEVRTRHQDPRASAGVAFCCGQLGNHVVAIAAGRESLDRGLRSNAVLNNVAFSLMRRSEFDEALPLLDEAVTVDQHSSTVFVNRAACRWMQAFQNGEATPDTAIEDIDNAIALSPDSAMLHVMAARMAAGQLRANPFALASMRDHVRHAVLLGWDRRNMTKDSFLQSLADDEVIRTLPIPAGEIQPSSEPSRLLSPISWNEV